MDRSPPDRAALHEAALRYLARYAATEAGLLRVLERRIARWVRETGADETDAAAHLAAAKDVARALAGAGVVDDAAFAEARARRLLRSGRSRRAVSAHLAAKGVAASVAEGVLPGPGDELAAALAFARRRRLGPFRLHPPDPDGKQRELGALARAGFPRAVAEQALGMEPDHAAALVNQLKHS